MTCCLGTLLWLDLIMLGCNHLVSTTISRRCTHAANTVTGFGDIKNKRWASWRDQEPRVHLRLQYFSRHWIRQTACTTKRKLSHQGWIPQPLYHRSQRWIPLQLDYQNQGWIPLPLDHQKQGWISHPWITSPLVGTPTLGSPKPRVDTPTLESPQPDGERASG